jgi:O-antigen/teichoic acid export membrane protein
MGMGIIKDVSEKVAGKDEDGARSVVNIAGNLQMIMSLVFIAAALPFSWWMSKALFADSRYWIYFAGITIVTPLALYPVAFASPVFYGFRKIHEYTKATIIYTLLGLALLAGLVWFYKVDGMFLQIIILSIAGFAIFLGSMKMNIGISPKFDIGMFRNRQTRAASAELFKFSLISFVPGTINIAVLMFLRGILMKQYGIEANGYFQVAYALSSYYLPFVTNGLWGHFYPEMCALQDDDAVNGELNQFVRFTLIASTAIAAGCITFRKYIIYVLFSGEFMKAYDLLAIQAVGDIFFVLFSMFSTSLMARRKFAGVITISTAGYNLVLLGSYFLLGRFLHLGFRNLNVAITVTNVIMVAVFLIHSRKETGFTVSAGNLALSAKCAALISLLILVPDSGMMFTAIKILCACAWLGISLTRNEISGGVTAAVSFFKRRSGQ